MALFIFTGNLELIPKNLEGKTGGHQLIARHNFTYTINSLDMLINLQWISLDSREETGTQGER